MEKIAVKKLTAQIEQKTILQDISFEVEAGQSLVIIGESGSGKTLLTKILIGQLPSSLSLQGEVHYDTMTLEPDSLKAWQQLRGSQVAYMSQNPMAMFNPFQTIQSHFWETLRSHSKISKDACIDKAVASMKEVRLGEPEELLKKYPFELSGGMLQRVMLAILLCLEPETIILDEPTSALDIHNREQIILILKEQLAKGKTLITVTHDYHLARELGGKILVMYQGAIMEEGLVAKLLESPEQSYSQDLILGNPYERLVKDDAGM
ncbi:ABC transporter ATP-binding protein [uncultured Streptococcus sp.]|uniref:ABC transporter ATP-binding protein n=1 Tax=uncultured Streptococcus sp. TaxID=83427 RepID=UPI0028EC7CF5|nr:ABC transporter ATP-binding protein [uncultured Streptococcus sp.]